MTSQFHPQLSHCGVYARDIDTMVALSIYFPDPEGNMVEIYMDTPWYVPQPHSVPIDLSLPNDEIMAQTEKHCRQTPGFMPLKEWQAEVERRLQITE